MKWALTFLTAAIFFGCGTVPAVSASREGIIRVEGKEYVRLNDLARVRGLEVRWIKRDESLQAVNQSTRISLKRDSREAELNGVQVWLLFPLVVRNGQAWISQLDVLNTFNPILSPPRGRAGASIKTICLDPGHGGKDPGNHAGTSQEKKYTMLLAEELRAQLVKAGFKVTLTRTRDQFVDLPDRPDFAKRTRGDLFLSLHFNAFSQGSARGAETYCLTPAGAPSSNARSEARGGSSFAGNRQNAQNMLLAYQLQKSLTKTLPVEDRGVRRARFAVLRDATMPAVLVEGGFMSNPAEARKIFDPAYRRQMARAIVEGVMAYKREVEK